MMSKQKKDVTPISQFDEKACNVEIHYDAVFDNSKHPPFLKNE
ncbi:hypothetical protein [Brumicola pallidula]|uniref:Uncharacterized protein n=1 Tax=Brumicola pallidula DSM 14239 = ACAM 615 TaxID=1121922 RepID=K6YAA7_9ALTE|nr:hypothetical protein [Glaciecola pallidula]GAC29684.1 hypothetical protein GPAL_2833 [Glaciecola pallidula DSM 14239 = ACAM 615]